MPNSRAKTWRARIADCPKCERLGGSPVVHRFPVFGHHPIESGLMAQAQRLLDVNGRDFRVPRFLAVWLDFLRRGRLECDIHRRFLKRLKI